MTSDGLSRREREAKLAARYGDRLPPGQHIVEDWPVLTYGPTPRKTESEWRFGITGLVRAERDYSLEEFKEIAWTTVHADFHCVTRFSVMDNDWEGVPVLAMMEKVEVLPEATAVLVHCEGGYTTNLILDDFLRPENLLAFRRNDAPLSAEHGGPVRLIVPHLYAWKSAKWVNGIELLGADAPGFWERNGYHMRGEPFAEERFG
jgi:DMSO/TMAO reductase YedYZ molybdopterin-dependent catalytic subunit